MRQTKSCLRQHYYFKTHFRFFYMILIKKSKKNNNPRPGPTIVNNHICLMITMGLQTNNIKKVTPSPPQALYRKTNVQDILLFLRELICFMQLMKTPQRTLLRTPQHRRCLCMFQVLPLQNLFWTMLVQVLSKVFSNM